jgi:hypothetical protein
LRATCHKGKRTGRGQNVVSAVRLFRFSSMSIVPPRNTDRAIQEVHSKQKTQSN